MTVLSNSGVIVASSSSNRVDTVTRARQVCLFPTCRSRIKTFYSIKSLCNHINSCQMYCLHFASPFEFFKSNRKCLVLLRLSKSSCY